MIETGPKRQIAAQRIGTFQRSRTAPCEPAEQRGAILGGGWGGKGAGQGEHRSVPHEPDTERGTSVPRIARCASSSKGKETGTVHRFAPPSERGFAPGQLLRVEATSCARGGWREVERVRSRAGES